MPTIKNASATYESAPNGGANVLIPLPGRKTATIEMDRGDVLNMAASVLHAAGITHATFDNGHLQAH